MTRNEIVNGLINGLDCKISSNCRYMSCVECINKYLAEYEQSLIKVAVRDLYNDLEREKHNYRILQCVLNEEREKNKKLTIEIKRRDKKLTELYKYIKEQNQ